MILVGHGLGSDLAQLARAGYLLPPDVTVFCTETAARWCWPEEGKYGLEYLALKITDMAEWRRSIGKQDMDAFERMPTEELAERCAGDTEAALKLYRVLDPELHAQGLTKIWNLAMDVLPTLSEMGGRGMQLNWSELEKKEQETRDLVSSERRAISDILGIENPDSPAQLAQALYAGRLHCKPHRRTEGGGWSTDRHSLLWARYCALHPARGRPRPDVADVLSRLINYSKKQKLHSTYYEKWIQENPDHRVHSFYTLGVTATGRLSSRETNLQNVPPEGRQLVVPSPGYDYILQADYKGIELCTAAHISGDPVLRRLINEAHDLHSTTAARVLDLPQPSDVAGFSEFKRRYPVERAIGKMTNFATLFGISARSLSESIFHDTEGEIYVGADTAQTYIDAFLDLFKGYHAYAESLWEKLHLGQPLVSPFGRHWVLPATPAGHRAATNYPIQSMASDLTLIGLRALVKAMKGMVSRVVGEVHDSIVFETTKAEMQTLCRIIREVLTNPDTREFGFTMAVPTAVELQAGYNWGDLHEI